MPADRGDFLFTVPARMNQEYKTLSSKKPRKLFSYPKPIKDIKPSSGLRHNSELQKTNREKLLGGMVGRGGSWHGGNGRRKHVSEEIKSPLVLLKEYAAFQI